LASQLASRTRNGRGRNPDRFVGSAMRCGFLWSRWSDSNRRPAVYETAALPLSYTGFWSPRRDSNPGPQSYQDCALPPELRGPRLDTFQYIQPLSGMQCRSLLPHRPVPAARSSVPTGWPSRPARVHARAAPLGHLTGVPMSEPITREAAPTPRSRAARPPLGWSLVITTSSLCDSTLPESPISTCPFFPIYIRATRMDSLVIFFIALAVTLR
jgi:hypothetical protein